MTTRHRSPRTRIVSRRALQAHRASFEARLRRAPQDKENRFAAFTLILMRSAGKPLDGPLRGRACFETRFRATNALHNRRASFETLASLAPQDEENRFAAFTPNLMLRSDFASAKSRLEARTMARQPTGRTARARRGCA
jgi:hypothetical protein